MVSSAQLAKLGNQPAISASVGVGGRNKSIDCAVVQNLLNAYYQATQANAVLPVNGIFDTALTNAIMSFQKTVVKLRRPDGKIDRHGKTIDALLTSAGTASVFPAIFSAATDFSLWSAMNTDRYVQLYQGQYSGLERSKVQGLRTVFDKIVRDPDVFDIRWGAYMLATIELEAAHTWQPIEETHALWSKSTGPGKYAEEVTVRDENNKPVKNRYYGRGYVQLTWRDKYVKLGQRLGIGRSLEIHPEKALEVETAYQIASIGMREGLFRTGYTLNKYIHGDLCDYYYARYIINGNNADTGLPDAADIIERYAIAQECLMTLSTVR